MIDLTDGVQDIWTLNGVRFEWMDAQATGTGVIDSFVEIGGNTNVVQAYNTTVNGVLDNGATDQFNHSITLGDVPVVDGYYQFLLDINEAKTDSERFLSLDEIMIWVGGPANPSTEDITDFGAPVYDMENGEGNWVALDYSRNPGSGAGDMWLYVPVGYFGGAGDDAIVTLYSMFGAQGTNPADYIAAHGAGDYDFRFNNSDGHEEWAVLVEEGIIPEPSTMSLVGMGMAALGAARYIRRKRG